MNKKQEAKINEILEEAGKLIEADEYSKVLELLEPIKDEKNGMVQCAIGVCGKFARLAKSFEVVQEGGGKSFD